MRELVFDWVVGAEKTFLRLAYPAGGSGACQITLGNWYQGQAVRCQGEWRFYLNSRSSLNGFEILTLQEELQADGNTDVKELEKTFLTTGPVSDIANYGK